MLLLKDLLKFTDEEMKNIKVKFNISHPGENDPIELYKTNPERINNLWLFWHKKQRYFQEGNIALCLVRLYGDFWLFTTIRKVTKLLDITDGVGYEGVEYDEYKDLYGRVIVKFHKDFQTQGRWFNTICDKLEIAQILPEIYDDDQFEGYDNVCLTFDKLERIINRNKSVWINALSNQKAVYLITDTNNGKLYVCSATGNNGMLLQRWSDYVSNGHGGNVELKEIVKQKGFDYVKNNFTYTILENYNSKVKDEYILKRESWWKNVLKTRKFGYNSN